MRILSVALTLLVAGSAAVAQSDFSSLRKLARETIVAANAPSMAIAVVRNGRILYEEGFGWVTILVRRSCRRLLSIRRAQPSAGLRLIPPS